MASYYFEVLPVHRRPRYIESFTSWVIRLCQDNIIPSTNRLSMVTGINFAHQVRQPDLLPPNTAKLSAITTCPESQIAETTLFNFGCKFGRYHEDQRQFKFFQDSIAQHLRYCPYCIAEYGYYSLLWRFKILPGCKEHECELLSCCPHCHEKVPLFRPPFLLGICHNCGGDLTDVDVPTLNKHDRAQTSHWHQQLEFLLSPVDWKYELVSEKLGPFLAAIRRERGMSAEELAQHSNVGSEKLKAIESQLTRSTRGNRFHDYVAYMDALNLDFMEVFLDLAAQLEHFPQREGWDQKQFYEELLLTKLKAARSSLEIRGKEVSQAELARAIGMTAPTLNYYAGIRTFLAQFSNEDVRADMRAEREDKLLAEVKAAVASLSLQNEVITYTAIGDIVGRAPEGFRLYERVTEYLNEVIGNQEQRFREREAIWLNRVNVAIQQLNKERKLVTQGAVSRLVGLSAEGLKLYPRIKEIMDAIADNYQEYVDTRPQTIIDQLEAAEIKLNAANAPVTRQSLAECIGLKPPSLNYYPEVLAKTQEILERNTGRNRELEQAQKEKEIIAEIYAAVEYLRQHDLPVTRSAIIDLISVSQRTISRYLEARRLLKQVVARG